MSYLNKYLKYKKKYLILKGGEWYDINQGPIYNTDLLKFINDISEMTNSFNKFNFNFNDIIYRIHHTEDNNILIEELNEDNIFVNKIKLQCNTGVDCIINDSQQYLENKDNKIFIRKIVKYFYSLIDTFKKYQKYNKVLLIIIKYFKKTPPDQNIFIYIKSLGRDYISSVTNQIVLSQEVTFFNIQSKADFDAQNQNNKISIRISAHNTLINHNFFEIYLNGILIPLTIDQMKTFFDPTNYFFCALNRIIKLFIDKFCFKLEVFDKLSDIDIYSCTYHPIIFDFYPEYFLKKLIKKCKLDETILKPLALIYYIIQLDDNLMSEGIDDGGLIKQFYSTLLTKLFDGTDTRLLKFSDSAFPTTDNEELEYLNNIGILLEHIYVNTKLNGLGTFVHRNYFKLLELLFKYNYNIDDHLDDFLINSLNFLCTDTFKPAVRIYKILYDFFKNTDIDVFLYVDLSKLTQKLFNIQTFQEHIKFIINKLMSTQTKPTSTLKKFINLNKKSTLEDFNKVFELYKYDMIDDTLNLDELEYNSTNFLSIYLSLKNFFINKYKKILITVLNIYKGFNKTDYQYYHVDLYETFDIYFEPSKIIYDETLNLANNILGLKLQADIINNLIIYADNKNNPGANPIIIRKVEALKLLFILLLSDDVTYNFDWIKDNKKYNKKIKWIEDFLFFVTGKPGIPKVNILIDSTSTVFCSSHTCFNTLDIPDTDTIFPELNEKNPPRSFEQRFYENLNWSMIQAGSKYSSEASCEVD